MPRFRCYHCNSPFGLEFTANGRQANCPSCGHGGPPHVVRLTNVHWVRFDPAGKIRTFGAMPQMVECLPDRTNLVNVSATAAIEAVTCPKCRASERFLAACVAYQNENDMHPDEYYNKSAVHGLIVTG